MVGQILEELSRFGNIVQSCQIKAGQYYMKDAYFNDTGLPLDKIMKNGKSYMLQTVVLDEIRKRPKFVSKINIVAKFFKN
jgi:hypothetical protein